MPSRAVRRLLPKIRVSKKDHRIARPPPGSLSQARARAEVTGADFPVGAKETFLPNGVIALCYNPRLPPTHAQFKVPLEFNKMDLRDYLWHCYQLRVDSMRSTVIQMPITYIERYSKRDIPGKKIAFRPRSIKKMICRLDKPFVWPADLAPEERGPTMVKDMETWALSKEAHQASLDQTKKEKTERAERFMRVLSLQRRAAALVEGRMEYRGDGAEWDTANGWRKRQEAEPEAEQEIREENIQEESKSATKREGTAALRSAIVAADPKTKEQRRHESKVLAKAKFLQRHGLRPQTSRQDSNSNEGRPGRRRAITL